MPENFHDQVGAGQGKTLVRSSDEVGQMRNGALVAEATRLLTSTMAYRPAMPVVHVRLRWPDGSVQQVYSPSLVITEHLEVGRSYPLPELMPLMRTGLHEASERVRAAYGFPCSLAAAALAEVESRAAAFGSGSAVVEAFER